MNDSPEIELARTLIRRHGLTPPVDVLKLAAFYATVELCSFPAGIDIDGVCLNLKRKNNTRILINKSKGNTRRRRFTIAHELGHVLIPWHSGSLVDDFGNSPFDVPDGHNEMELEANRFASEILMPTAWLSSLNIPSPAALITKVMAQANVSYQAAFLKVLNFLPAGYVYANVEDCIVISSGRSPGTLANALHAGTVFYPDFHFAWAKEGWASRKEHIDHYWWNTRTNNAPEQSAQADDWRTLIDIIVEAIYAGSEQAEKFKRSINGVAASVNSRIKSNRSLESIFEACCQRFNSLSQQADDFCLLVQDERFKKFLTARVIAFLKKKLRRDVKSALNVGAEALLAL